MSQSGKKPTTRVKATDRVMRDGRGRRARARARVVVAGLGFGDPHADHDAQVQERGDDRRHHGDDRDRVAVLRRPRRG